MLATAEQLTPLSQLLTRVLGKRPAPATMWRWLNLGVKVGDQRVKLDAVRIGCKLYSTAEAVADFIAAQNPAPAEDAPTDGERSAETRDRLQAAGLI